ncbi:MAG: phosphate ABC transporter substrate-binding protein PstS, partial [Proteobacteria bacterium]|nr:phosphate ABC transporter substrate-binding protein PstS [Pseudomonadota bacterium]
KFFAWAFEKGDRMAEDLDYIPMPENVVTLIKASWEKEIVIK